MEKDEEVVEKEELGSGQLQGTKSSSLRQALHGSCIMGVQMTSMIRGPELCQSPALNSIKPSFNALLSTDMWYMLLSGWPSMPGCTEYTHWLPSL